MGQLTNLKSTSAPSSLSPCTPKRTPWFSTGPSRWPIQPSVPLHPFHLTDMCDCGRALLFFHLPATPRLIAVPHRTTSRLSPDRTTLTRWRACQKGGPHAEVAHTLFPPRNLGFAPGKFRPPTSPASRAMHLRRCWGVTRKIRITALTREGEQNTFKH
jgi:hypothetical protein